MSADLFAGIVVGDLERAIAWYSQLFGVEPAFRPNEVEAVWELAPERHVFVELDAARAGHARHLLFVDDLTDRIAAAADRGVHPDSDERVTDGVRKVGYVDPDGNRFEFGGGVKASP